METPIEFQSKTLDLSVLYPAPTQKPKPYATQPMTAKSVLDKDRLASIAPNFANTIKLRTLSANLNLEFGFTNNTEQGVNIPLSSVVLSSETAKQLLFALAELFQCDIVPKG